MCWSLIVWVRERLLRPLIWFVFFLLLFIIIILLFLCCCFCEWIWDFCVLVADCLGSRETVKATDLVCMRNS